MGFTKCRIYLKYVYVTHHPFGFCDIIYLMSVTFGKVPNISLHTAHLVLLYHHFRHMSKTAPLTLPNSMQLFPTVQSRSPPFWTNTICQHFFASVFQCPCLSHPPLRSLVDFLLWVEIASFCVWNTPRRSSSRPPTSPSRVAGVSAATFRRKHNHQALSSLLYSEEEPVVTNKRSH